MNYKGMMDGWSHDENECQGRCGICDNCSESYYESSDEAYEKWRFEEEDL